jgi:hypothetical protein
MPGNKIGGCGCGFGHRRSAFGNKADTFFNNLNGIGVSSCLQNGGYYQNNATPLTHSSGFGKKSSFGTGPMKIGSKKK